MPTSSISTVAGPSGLSTTISTSSANGIAGPSQVSNICTSLSSDEDSDSSTSLHFPRIFRSSRGKHTRGGGRSSRGRSGRSSRDSSNDGGPASEVELLY